MVLFAVLLGFTGMLLIYRPIMHFAWYYHVAGLISGIVSAIAYLTLSRLAGYYDPRVIVLSFLLSGFHTADDLYAHPLFDRGTTRWPIHH